MSNKTSLTMKDIAREMGVSVATVSRALKDSPRISPERRKAIQQYAKEHNFTPNVIAESLRYARVQPLKIIGVIIPEFTHFYFMSVLSGIEEEASRRGYRIMVAQSEESYEREVKTGTNAAVSAPSPNSLRAMLGMAKARVKAACSMPAPMRRD